MSTKRDVYDLLQARGMHDRLREGAAPYRVLGGIAAHAILGASEIHWDDRVIELHPATILPLHRANGTPRDIDVLVMTTDWEEASDVEGRLTDTVGDELPVSVFGIEEHPTKRPIGPNMDFVSRRTLDAGGGHHVILDHIDARLPDTWYDEWTVTRDDAGGPLFATLSPTAIEAAYHMCSITGIHPKDKPKLTAMRQQLKGPLAAQYETQYQIGEAFRRTVELAGRDSRTWFGRRARLLGQLEKSARLVERARGGWGQALSPFVGHR